MQGGYNARRQGEKEAGTIGGKEVRWQGGRAQQSDYID